MSSINKSEENNATSKNMYRQSKHEASNLMNTTKCFFYTGTIAVNF